MKNALLSIVAKQRQTTYKRKNKNEPRILVVSTTGLGDSLWGTPSIRAIKNKYPKGYLALLTSSIGKEIFTNNPYVDEIFSFKDPALLPLIKILPKIQKKKFDTAIIFHLSQRPVLPFVYLSGPETLIGTKGLNKGFDHLLTHSLNNDPVHEIERRMNLTKNVGIKNFTPQMEIFLTKKEKNIALDCFDDNSVNIGIHPGAKNSFKRWNPKHFITLGRQLAREQNAKIWITGNKSEKDLTENIAANIPGAQSLAGKFSIRLTAALIERFDLFITNDTGPMHIGFAMGTPTISLFGPTDPKICGPYKISNAKIITKTPTCSPCIKKKCFVPFCMEQISPELVWKECLKD